MSIKTGFIERERHSYRPTGTAAFDTKETVCASWEALDMAIETLPLCVNTFIKNVEYLKYVTTTTMF